MSPCGRSAAFEAAAARRGKTAVEGATASDERSAASKCRAARGTARARAPAEDSTIMLTEGTAEEGKRKLSPKTGLAVAVRVAVRISSLPPALAGPTRTRTQGLRARAAAPSSARPRQPCTVTRSALRAGPTAARNVAAADTPSAAAAAASGDSGCDGGGKVPRSSRRKNTSPHCRPRWHSASHPEDSPLEVDGSSSASR